MSKLELQKELEALFSKNQLIPRITNEFTQCKGFSFLGYFKKLGLKPEFGFSLLVQMVLHKRADLPTLVGLLRRHCDSAQDCVDQLQKAAEGDLIDWSPAARVFVIKPGLDITPDVQAELDRFQFPLPMVVVPKEIKNNRQSGYLLNNSSVLLRDNHHEDDVCLDHLNRVNKIKLTVNQDTAKMIKNSWKNLDKAKDGESKDEFERRKKAFAKYDKSAHEVINLVISEGNEFHLTHRYDKRGRTYSQGYAINVQGNPWNKAIVEFFDKELVV